MDQTVALRHPTPTRPSRHDRTRTGGAVLALLAAFVLTALTPTSAYAWDLMGFSSSDEKLLIQLTNESRAAAGLPALKTDADLTSMARWRSKDMGDRDYFSHAIPPDGKKVFDYLKADGYCYKAAGENIGTSSYPDDVVTQRIHNLFMGSSSHRANILGTWTNIGVGAYKDAEGNHLFTVLFSVPCSSTPSPTPTPTPTPTPNPTPTPAPTPTPNPTPTPTPNPNPTPTPTPKPTATPKPTPTPSVDPGASVEPTPSPSVEPTPMPSVAPIEGEMDPAEEAGSLAAGLHWVQVDAGGVPTASPGPADSPEPSPSPGSLPESGSGLQVIDPADPAGLVDAIVGDVTSGFLGD